MANALNIPDFIFESSWEVCNKVGGIYTVLSTRAKVLNSLMQDRIIFIGPDCWGKKTNPYFIEDNTLYTGFLSWSILVLYMIKKTRYMVGCGKTIRLIPCMLMVTMTRLPCSPMPQVWSLSFSIKTTLVRIKRLSITEMNG